MDNRTILERIKEQLDLSHDIYDYKIKFYIELFCNKIKSICYREDFPPELDYLAIKFAKNSYLYYKDKESSNNERLQATSASDNGQTVNFKVVETVTKDDVDLEKVIEKNINEISRYAKMRW